MQEPILCRLLALMRRETGTSSKPNDRNSATPSMESSLRVESRVLISHGKKHAVNAAAKIALFFCDRCQQLLSCSLDRVSLRVAWLNLVSIDEGLCCKTVHNMSFNARWGTLQIRDASMRRNSARSTEMLAIFARGVVPLTVELFQQRSIHMAMMLSGAFTIYQTGTAVAGDVLQPATYSVSNATYGRFFLRKSALFAL